MKCELKGLFCRCCESSSAKVPRAETRLLIISVNIKTIVTIKTWELIISSHFTELEGVVKKGEKSVAGRENEAKFYENDSIKFLFKRDGDVHGDLERLRIRISRGTRNTDHGREATTRT